MTASTRLRAGLLAVLFSMSAAPAIAHELQDNRLTLVLREPRHVSLQFYLDFVSLLRPTVEPTLSADAFAAKYAAAPTAVLARILHGAESGWERQVGLTAGGDALQVGNWRWPELAVVRKALEQRAMQVLVDPARHPDAVVLAVSADGVAKREISALQLHLPPAMYPILVVSYQPQQAWFREGQTNRVRFAAPR